MIRKEKGGIQWLEFSNLQNIPGLVHGVFLRSGGVSNGSFDSLNALKGQDEDSAVLENRRRIAHTLQLESLVAGRQVHGTHIHHVLDQQEAIPDCDALMTDRLDCGLLTLHADCQAAIFYDPIQHVIASAHAGWRGQVQNIYGHLISRMASTFGTKPSDLLVCISPSLGPENAEFVNYRTEFPSNFWQFQFKPNHFDLWAISRAQLEQSGVLPQNIEIAQMDTVANEADFFSYRREKRKGRTEKITGGHGTVIGLLYTESD